MISRTTKFYIIIMRMKKNLPHQLLHLFPNQLPIPGKFHKSRRKTRDHFPKKKQKNWEQPDQTPNPLVTCSAKADKMVWNFELLIETIKKYPSLWNIKDKNYRNRVERNSDWTKVLVEIGLTHNHKECTRKRWDSIKTNYTRSKNIPSGSGAQKKYRHAILLAFLDDTQTPRATKTVMNEGRVNKVVEGKKVSY
ncbi:uncharacterized protein LOC129943039 isoform X3 [Eupeodes corollae]|uniref:uncharacterized protein LOC129943039 isoform X3 n=1 Tax=Eupeodes corollae TaxID=290404 RepID=UPI002491157B|nr:uncharacterized protein LOC129943039 isoform X3 [Eupeodes corollae]